MKHLFLRHTRWMTLIVMCVGMGIHVDAQTFTQRIQKRIEGRGNVTIHHSQEIDRLVNLQDGNTSTSSAPATSSVVAPPHGKNEVANGRKDGLHESERNAEKGKESPHQVLKPTSPDADEAVTTDFTKKVMRNSHKVTGYRVQAFAGGNSRVDRQTAERARNDIKSHYPHVAVYVHFYSPRWICRVGNYRTYEEAHEMLVNLQRLGYKQASIVKGKITVQY